MKYRLETEINKTFDLKGFVPKYCNNIYVLKMLDAVLFLLLINRYFQWIRRRIENLESNMERKLIRWTSMHYIRNIIFAINRFLSKH